ncbi:MAG: hypothetical protein EA425_03260, partial [Puniceicoccaceae bacterium]
PTLFTELDPAETGLASFENNYSSPDVWGARWREYLLGTIGTGIAAGDVTGNGLPDLFIVSKNEQSRLYENLGGFRFRDITAAAGITPADAPGGGVAFADVNNNGHLDIYICFVGAPNQLWINDGAGRFTEEARQWGVDINTGSVMAVFADFDRDGLLDLYLVTNLLHEGDDYSGPLPDRLFRNLGDRFEDVSEAAGISGRGHGHAAVWWDFNNNGWPDLYVANDFEGEDWLFLNQGDGTFVESLSSISPQSPYYSMGVDFGDINHNGRFDLLGTDMVPTDRIAYHRTVGNHVHLYENRPLTGVHQYAKNVLLLNLGDGRMAEIAALAGLDRTDWTWAARLVDLNNNGRLDAFFTNGMIRAFNDGDLGSYVDFAGSGERIERAFRPSPISRETNLAFRNEGNLRFKDQSVAWGLGRSSVSFGAAFADLDGDGNPDLIINNYKEPPSVFRHHNTEAGHRITLRLVGTRSNRHGLGARVEVVAGELNQVKLLYPQRGYMGSDEPILHFGLGPHERIDNLDITWPSGLRQSFTGLEANRRYTITEPDSAEASGPASSPLPPTRPRFARAEVSFPPEAERRQPDPSEFALQPLLPIPESRRHGPLAAADLTGDGHSDLILGGATGHPATILINRGNLRFEAAWSPDLEDDFLAGDAGLALADFNGNGHPDLVAASGGVRLEAGDAFYADRLYWNRGNGDFERDPGTAFSRNLASTGAVAVADFDGDGRPDVFLGGLTIPGRYPHAPPSSLWRNTATGFVRVDPDVAPGLAAVGRVSAAAWADLDGNGFPDLVLLREWEAPMIWRNHGDRLVHDPEAIDTPALSGLWTSLAIADLNGNGRLDLVVGNLGLNTPYFQPSREYPARLWFTAAPAGPVRLLETMFEDGREYPRVNLRRLRQEFPRELRPFRTFTEFAQATVADIFGNLAERGYHHHDLTEVRSGILWQQEDGRFRFEPFPAFAQSGRAFSILPADISGNGLPDLVLSLELPSPKPWTGRIERGHLALLLNHGDGHFVSELPGESGLSIGAASPRGLAWTDLDGDGREELVVHLLDGPPIVFSR